MEGIVDDVVRNNFGYDEDETVVLPMVTLELNKHLQNPNPLESLTLKCIKNIIRYQSKPQTVDEVRYKLIFQGIWYTCFLLFSSSQNLSISSKPANNRMIRSRPTSHPGCPAYCGRFSAESSASALQNVFSKTTQSSC